MLAPSIRDRVGPAPPDAISTASAGFTMPMSLARMDRTGPVRSGSDEW